MRYDPRPFREKPERQELHDDMTRNTHVSPAVRADGAPAVLINFGRSFGVISLNDAIKFATIIADTVDKAKKGTERNR